MRFAILKLFLYLSLFLAVTFNSAPSYAGVFDVCDWNRGGGGTQPSEESLACWMHFYSMYSLTASGLGAGAAALYLVGLANEANRAIDKIEVCREGSIPAPLPYSDNFIKSTLQNNSGLASEIIERYDKICIKEKNTADYHWLATGECATIGVYNTCAFEPLDEVKGTILCARISSTCPCVANLSNGIFEEPDYNDDADAMGNKTIKNESDYKARLGQHCIILRLPETDQTRDDLNDGIIDEVCSDLVGYSKADIHIISGPMQCIFNTMHNMFAKPIRLLTATNNNLSDDEKETVNKFDHDLKAINSLILKATDLRSSCASTSGCSVNNTLYLDLKNRVSNLYDSNQTTYDHLYLPDKYSTTIPPWSLGPSSSAQDIFNYSNTLISQFANLNSVIVVATQEYIYQIQNRTAKQTTFKSFQANLSIVVAIAIVFFVMMFGYNFLITGKMNDPVQTLIKLFLVSYFAIGTAWQDWFFTAIINVSTGLADIMLFVDTTNPFARKCKFNDATYTVKASEKCHTIQDANAIDPFASSVRFNSVTNNEENYCIKGNFIFRPNYEKPFNIYKYSQYINGNYVEKYLNLYCFSKYDPTSTAIAKIKYDADNKPLYWYCPDSDYLTEPGYRLSEYVNLGLITSQEASSFASNANISSFVTTAMFTSSGDGISVPIDKDLIIANGEPTIKDRRSFVRYLESKRNSLNLTNNYPIVNRYGYYVNYQWIAVVDQLDCSVGLAIDSKNGFVHLDGIAGVFFSGFIGIILVIAIFISIVYLFFAVFSCLQAFAVSIIMIVVLIFLSPVIILTSLFDKTKTFYDKWFKMLKQYVVTFPISVIQMSFLLATLMYCLYGSSTQAASNNMFTVDSEGNYAVSSLCYEQKIHNGLADAVNVPLACHAKRLQNDNSNSSNQKVLGESLRISNVSDSDLLNMFLATLKFILIMMMFTMLGGQIESIISDMLGGAGDTRKLDAFDMTKEVAGVAARVATVPFKTLGKLANRATSAIISSRESRNTDDKRIADAKKKSLEKEDSSGGDSKKKDSGEEKGGNVKIESDGADGNEEKGNVKIESDEEEKIDVDAPREQSERQSQQPSQDDEQRK